MSFIRFRERLRIPTYDNMEYVRTGRVIVDEEKCDGCGRCAAICPADSIRIVGVGKNKKAFMDEALPECMSCNDCAAICEKDAIESVNPYDFGFFFKRIHIGEMAPPRKF